MSESSPKSTVAYQKIRNLILSGRKLPGTRLVVMDLEQELGLGRGPIRDALIQLGQSGLVQVIPYKGAVVSCLPSDEELAQIYDLRVELESFMAIAAMEKATAPILDELEALLATMEDYDVAKFVQLDKEFHKKLRDAPGMPFLCRTAERVFEVVEVFLSAYPPDEEECRETLEEHRSIVRAMRDRNAETLKMLLSRNLRRGLLLIRSEGARKIRRLPF